MKSTELKKMIKDAVKEAIQEELKDILLEAVRAPKGSVAVVQESIKPEISPVKHFLSILWRKCLLYNSNTFFRSAFNLN